MEFRRADAAEAAESDRLEKGLTAISKMALAAIHALRLQRPSSNSEAMGQVRMILAEAEGLVVSSAEKVE